MPVTSLHFDLKVSKVFEAIYCADKEDDLLQGINSYRKSLSLPALSKNKKADCVADEIADQLEDQPCTATTSGAYITSGTQTQLTNYPKPLKKCKVDPSTTSDGVVLPVCVPHLVPTLVLTNYTRSRYAKYVNDSKFTGAGIGSEDDWMVLVLSSNKPTGSFSSAVSLISQFGFHHYYLVLFLLLGFSLLVVS